MIAAATRQGYSSAAAGDPRSRAILPENPEASAHRAQFEQFGLPPTFLGDFRTKVHELQWATDVQIAGLDRT